MKDQDWKPRYSHRRHGGWYVTNVWHLSGAVGCVSNNYDDKKWRIVCGDFAVTYPSRDAAARAEREIALKETNAKAREIASRLRMVRPTNQDQRAELEAMTQEDLDEAIYEAKADEAAEINNSGRETQINYFLTRWSGRTFVLENET